MALCLSCLKYAVRGEDRYCGLCGKPLCRLAFGEGEDCQIDVPPEADQCVVHMRNAGLADLQVRFREPQAESWAKPEPCNQWIDLQPFADPVKVIIRIDRCRLEGLQGYCDIPFESTDPEQPTGHLRVCQPSQGGIVVAPEVVSLGEVSATQPGQPPIERAFSVRVTNNGGYRCRVKLVPRPPKPTEIHPVVVRMDGDERWVAGWGSADIRLRAWSDRADANRITDELELELQPYVTRASGLEPVGRKITGKVKIEARFLMPPVVEPATLVFGKPRALLPGQIDVGQIRVLNKSGTKAFRITAVRSSSRYLLPITPLPADIPSGEQGGTLEFVFSTRFGSRPVLADVDGDVELHTDSGYGPPVVPFKGRLGRISERRGYLGLDFGTVNSCVAYHNGALAELPAVVSGDGADGSVPSIAVFVNQDVFVTGGAAANWAHIYPATAIYSVKRALVEGDRDIFGRTYKVVELASLAIEQLLLEASRRQGVYPVGIAMSVPVGFVGYKRRCLLEACRAACERAFGVRDAHIAIVDEPTAAAIAYIARSRDRFAKLKHQEKHRILVFDFGGGTLDVCVVSIEQRDTDVYVQVGAPRGGSCLGGIDIDLAILREMARRAGNRHPDFAYEAITACGRDFRNRWSASPHYSLFTRERWKWYQQARSVKERLSNEDVVAFTVDALYDREGQNLLKGTAGSLKYEEKLTRSEFETIIRGHIERAQRIVKSSLEACGISETGIHTVLMTGQSCRMPVVRATLQNMFPNAYIPPEAECPLKECVCEGAALAAFFSAHNAALRVEELAVTPYRYGVVSPGLGSHRFTEIIPAGRPFDTACGFYDLSGARNGSILLGAAGAAGDAFAPADDDLQIIGRVPVDDNGAGRLEIRFQNKELVLTVDGQERDILPPDEDTTEASYL